MQMNVFRVFLLPKQSVLSELHVYEKKKNINKVDRTCKWKI